MRLGKQRHESKYLAIEDFNTNKGWSISWMSISWMCHQLGITRSAFYKWKHRIVPEQEQLNSEIAELIKEYDERFSHILGYRRMTDWINHFNHTNYSRKRIHRIMKKLDIHAVIRKKKKKYKTAKPEESAENKLARNFYTTAPNKKWVTDVTEFKIPNSHKKLYLSAILDLYDRYPIAFVISGRNDNRLVFKTFDKAIEKILQLSLYFTAIEGFNIPISTFKKSWKILI
ncbi:DDE-type integrase/transposase/recombinase [Streptococcus sp.]|uniref:DDE-type integrase/transposase/recombinase n=1 Tax=Streptococcus sp. TaxID=1306 RepID=UPI0025E2554C|nr:DDE-type integrase/transposase/recombinase [Streptococcus sp.]MBS6932817.1 IS3 family transposase [Streptococcus sp.]